MAFVNLQNRLDVGKKKKKTVLKSSISTFVVVNFT